MRVADRLDRLPLGRFHYRLLLLSGLGWLFDSMDTGLVSFFNLGAWGVTYGYTPELYPTRLRGTGTGSAAAFGRIGGILAPLVVGRLMAAAAGPGGAGIESAFSAVFAVFTSVLLAGALAVAVFGEETRGRTLEQIAAS